MNLPKEVKDLLTENYKTLMKKWKKTKINGKIFHVHGLEELILLKCPYYPKQSTDSVQSLSKFQLHISKSALWSGVTVVTISSGYLFGKIFTFRETQGK